MVLTDEERKENRKKTRKKYKESRKGQAKIKEYSNKWNKSSGMKSSRKKYNHSEKGKLKQKTREQRPDVVERREKVRQDNRLNVLQHYSKLLSNSESVCCNCCGLNTHLDFLAIDHIAGKKQMDSEPELIKLGYRSTLRGNGLIRWILNNNFPKGFQVLCTNCNTAKAYPKNNNKCPLEGKPH